MAGIWDVSGGPAAVGQARRRGAWPRGKAFVYSSPGSLRLSLGPVRITVPWFGIVPPQRWFNYFHAHGCIELVHVFEGGGRIDFSGGSERLAEGTVAFAPAGESHRISAGRAGRLGIHYLAMDIEPVKPGEEQWGSLDARQAALLRGLVASPFRVRHAGKETGIGSLFRMIFWALESGVMSWHSIANSAALSLVFTFARIFSASPVADSGSREVSRWQDLISSGKLPPDEMIEERFVEFMYRHIGADVRMEDVARYTGVNARKIQRVMKRNGYGFRSLLQAGRLDRAKYLLIGNAMPVGEVGRAAGFPSTSHFISVFRRRLGLTPRELRRIFSGPGRIPGAVS